METFSTLTAAEWSHVKRRLSKPLSGVHLLIDGYNVVLGVGRISKKTMTYGIIVYVNNEIRPEWYKEDCEIRRKFYCKRTCSRYSKVELRCLPKSYQLTKEWKDMYNARQEYYEPFWRSFNPLKKHLLENCKSIKIVEPKLASTSLSQQKKEDENEHE